MNIQWKIYLDNLKRVYKSIFDNRDIEIIKRDYYSDKWISKSELEKLFKSEIAELVTVATEYKNQYNELLEGFNLNALRNYELLERKFQGNTKMT